MKNLLIFLFCILKNEYIIENKRFKDLKFNKYKLYQVSYIFGFIKLLIYIDETDSLDRNKKVYDSWYYNYNIIKTIYKEV
jgi:hypothetical protein